MITRRNVLRGLSLAGLAVTAGSLLDACGSSPAPGPILSGGGDLELVSADVRRTAGAPASVPAVVAGTQGLGAGLYAQLNKDDSTNLAISPYSAELALALTVNGALGTTRSEMLTVLGVSDLDTLNGGLNALSADLAALAGPVAGQPAQSIALTSANALFGQAGEDWGKPFLDTLASDYGAGMQTVDWKTSSSAAAAAVNTWTSQHTEGRIPTIVDPSTVGPDTRLVLVNALYFKAPWQTPFDKSLTAPAAFTLGDGSTVQVPTMKLTEPAASISTAAYDAVQLPYSGDTLVMTLVLPAAGGLPALERSVAAGGLADILGAFAGSGVSSVTVELPSFTFSTSSDLTTPLKSLGMSTAFRPSADFSAMTTTEALQIDFVVQQVFVAVDEAGTEAAAATAVGMGATAVRVDPANVAFDRPFLFAIHDTKHGTPLFVGRVADPRAS